MICHEGVSSFSTLVKDSLVNRPEGVRFISCGIESSLYALFQKFFAFLETLFFRGFLFLLMSLTRMMREMSRWILTEFFASLGSFNILFGSVSCLVFFIPLFILQMRMMILFKSVFFVFYFF